jgi:hypothetical protein
VFDTNTLAGELNGCTVRLTVTDTDYVQIAAEYGGNTAETTSIPKNRWVGRSGLKEYATEIAAQLDVDDDLVHEILNDLRVQALLLWNWKTFMQVGSATAPSFEHLKSLTVPDSHVGSYPTTAEVRENLGYEVENAMRNTLYSIFDSPTGSGKSYKMSTTMWLEKPGVTGGRQVVHLSPTTDAREGAVDYSEDEDGLSHYVLLGRTEACPLARGDHDPDGDERTITVDKDPVSEWIAKMCDHKNLSLHDAKTILLEKADQELDHIPCGGEDGKCKTKEQWEDISDSIGGEPEYDVIHATHKFSFVSTLIHGNNVSFDEQPTFALIGPGDVTGGRATDDGLDTDRVKKAVSALLDDADVDIDNADELMSMAKRNSGDLNSIELAQEFPEVYDVFRHRPDREWYYKHPDAHTSANAFAELLWDAARQSPDANGRRSAQLVFEPPTLSKTTKDEEIINRQRGSIVVDTDNNITTLRVGPDVSGARSVIGFNAHPIEELWRLDVGDAMSVKKLMSDEERRLWRRYERRLLVIQVGHGAYSYTSDERFDVEKNNVLIETLREQYGEHFRTAIAPSAVEDHVEESLSGAGVENPETMHHMNTESRNDFQGERIGAQIGCIDPGDNYVLDLLAELGMDARVERQDALCETCTGDGCSECNHTGHQRAFGRGFVGKDAESAENLLASVRENEVAQANGRYGREADNPDDWAAVFSRTSATPDNMVDFKGPWVWKYEEKQKEIVEYLRENITGTAKQISEWITGESDIDDSCTKEWVRRTILEQIECGNVEKHEGMGYNGATIYEWTAADSVSKHGELKFEITEVDHSESQVEEESAASVPHTVESD